MRPDLDRYMMELAKVAATRTTCVRRGVGCVLADAKGRVLSIGYNGVASGMPHCNESTKTPVYSDDPRVVFNIEKLAYKFDGKYTKRFKHQDGLLQCVGFDETFVHACKGHDLPPGQDSCESLHAEQNALVQCADADRVATAYVTLAPCKPCTKLLLGTACQRVVFLEGHDGMGWSQEMWRKAGRAWETLSC